MNQFKYYKQWGGVWLCLAFLAGCSSTPIQFHTLMPLPTDTPSDQQEKVVVESVSVPPQVNRTELVVREDASGLLILESEWWGSSLPEEIQSALTARLDGPRTPHPVRAWVTVSRFDTIVGQAAWLEAEFRLSVTQDQNGRMTCSFRQKSTAGDSVTSLVLAHQDNVETLAQRIAEAARQLKQGQTHCP
ncbi:PqiC family protein [Marinobacter fonticola]|uniref:PqiC family protein n=1 Tax=Marinobacter fonticola TaxID=2603215 RepID=UPI0011E683D7|nr:ABC-type transport auxiliary lipoprotein family protein [Marinobacter fonticola]